METYLHKEETYKIIGACFVVYNEMGCGFLESVYQECMEMELGEQSVPFQSQQKLRLKYKGKRLEKTFEPDFVCFDKIIVEIKAVSVLTDEHRAQLINYLHALALKSGYWSTSGIIASWSMSGSFARHTAHFLICEICVIGGQKKGADMKTFFGGVVAAGIAAAGLAGEVRFDFESGDLQGWQVLDGAFGKVVSDREKEHHGGGPYTKEGKYFLSTLESADGQRPDDSFQGVSSRRWSRCRLRT
jgi:GxxExxY protein